MEQELWNFMYDHHDLTLTSGEVDEIIDLIK